MITNSVKFALGVVLLLFAPLLSTYLGCNHPQYYGGSPYVEVNDWTPNETVKVLANGVEVGQFTTGADGHGSLDFGQAGMTYTVTLVTANDQQIAAGSVSCPVNISGQVDRIDLSPPAANLQMGETQQFTATGYNAQGDQVPTMPTWSTNDGAIDSNGLYTPSMAGDFTITATDPVSSATGTASVHVVSGQPFRIDVSPANVTLKLGESQLFTAKGYDAAGNQVPITPTWTTTGGNIDANGLYTPSATGDFIITATDPISTVADTGIVHVGPGQFDRIDVSPANVTLKLGESQLFTAKGYDAAGNQVPITPTWSTNDGAIDSSGLYTASEAGSFTVTASVAESTVTGQASVEVEGAGVPIWLWIALAVGALGTGGLALWYYLSEEQKGCLLCLWIFCGLGSLGILGFILWYYLGQPLPWWVWLLGEGTLLGVPAFFLWNRQKEQSE